MNANLKILFGLCVNHETLPFVIETSAHTRLLEICLISAFLS